MALEPPVTPKRGRRRFVRNFPYETAKAPENIHPVASKDKNGFPHNGLSAQDEGSDIGHQDLRLIPPTANPTLRLSTTSLGAVKRKRCGSPSSAVTGDSFYSTIGNWKECKQRDGVINQYHEDDGMTNEVASEEFEKAVNIMEDLASDNSCSVRRASFDSTIYEPSSVASSPQHKNDHPFHLINPLSPPPRFLAFRASANSIIGSSLSTTPTSTPFFPASPCRSTDFSGVSSLTSRSSSITTFRQSRNRCCSYTSLHTGIRCNAPAYDMQFLCVRHLHRSNSPSNFAHTEKKEKDASFETIGQRWPQELFRGETLGERHFYDSYNASPDDSIPLDSSLSNIFTSFQAPRISKEFYSKLPNVCSPPIYSASTIGNGSVDLASPVEPPLDNVTSINNTVIDWKSNESRRREYEEADRRKKGMWNWVRRRIMSLCCVKEPNDFWDGDSRNDNRSVRRYRLVLPEEKSESGEEEKEAEPGKLAGLKFQRVVRRASLGDVSWKFSFGRERGEHGGVKVLKHITAANSERSAAGWEQNNSSPLPASYPAVCSRLASRAHSEDGGLCRNRLYSASGPWSTGRRYPSRRTTRVY